VASLSALTGNSTVKTGNSTVKTGTSNSSEPLPRQHLWALPGGGV
jgi:hypothetical protein